MWQLIYPPTCVLCLDRGSNGQDICQACLDELPRNHQACPICAEPMPRADSCCGHCIAKRPPFDRIYAPFLYEFPLSELIGALKFHGRLPLSRLLGEMMGDELERMGTAQPDMLMPVPLHTKRLRQRGYNQALELARPLARRFATRLDTSSCQRSGNSEALSHLDRKHRQQAIRGAFTLNPTFRANHVAIIDDVVTTGSTVTELAKLLRKAGVGRIDVWAVARTPDYGQPRRPVLP